VHHWFTAASMTCIFLRHLLNFLEQNEDNTGRCTNNPPIQTNWCPTSAIPTTFMLDALPGTTLPIYPGLGQALNMLACIPSGFLKIIFGHVVIIPVNGNSLTGN